ncbi:ribosome maturation factor RimP [Nitrosospira sp. Nsp5]|jgi:ribosome maturation factor RimP|uniref:Ribosome maturation factor RimP n=1 Tax=Nitrosospira multiformis TaxID=1231 RepID=A0ABY0TH11_9PROT|nr:MULTISPECIES: ribosome maturation factor RimP [Nitrosospira]PTR05877.1 ribosome maturation factor RimP [Nitrosospira sp. Nsp5]SCY33724.1 ribosome maturation factor RimP [Nitrosospira sp. Nsp13]SDQ60097.1 ribosome maturation factor RimP [Nitrosospira multiformis]
MDLHELLDSTLTGLGYELVDVERSARGKLIRVFIDKPNGVSVDDCVAVSNHLSRLLAVENIDYDRLEISSPGLDRPLKKVADFIRFAGESAKLRLRVALEGQRNFVGILREVNDGVLKLEVDGKMLDLELNNLEKARLIPKL